MADFSRRLFPEPIETEIRRLPWRLGGASLAMAAAAGYASLLTWSNADPSFNHATDKPAHNLLGAGGAVAADLLMQLAGLAAIVMLLPPLLWGLGIMRGLMPERIPKRLSYWAAATLLIASGLSAIPPPKTWPLDNGLGGVAGDLLAAFFVRIGGFIEPGLASAIGAALATAAGVWALFKAMELPAVSDLAHAAAQRPRYRHASREAYSEPEEAPQKIIRRMTLLQARLLPAIVPVLSRALMRRPAGPREFWMKESVFSSIAEAVATVKAGLEKTIAKERKENHERVRAEEEMFRREPRLDSRVEPYFGPVAFDSATNGGWEDDEADIFDGSRSQTPYRVPDGLASNEPLDEEEEVEPSAGRPARAQEFMLPPLKLLSEPSKKKAGLELSDEALRERAAMLETVLGDFGVKGRITRVFPGPVITLYELEPARGTKSSRVIGLADDIARSMSAVSARVAVIPGRDAIGVELPNETPETVHLRDLLVHDSFQQNPAKLALALGRTISGQPLIADLAKMPHLLIAGTTGSGKSVGINAMILSLLYRLTPAEARFIMIDPKMLELSVYDGIPHLLTPVVTDPKKAIAALKWTVNEMNVRYERMCKLGVRNIGGYNQKVLHAQLRQRPLRRTVNTGFDELSGAAIYECEEIPGEPLPYIIVVIDEMADLMMVAGKEIEYCVMRLAQMARAAGIHLITATQRPSVDVITGTIKANFPSRISYQVTSKIDSRTILGEQGAEQLLGSGDMLYMAAGGRISRAHGPFVSESDVEKVTRFLKAQGAPDYLHEVTEAADEAGERGEAEGGGRASGDKLYDEAVAIVVAEKRATTSYLQRRLGIGYNKAATLIERMEEDGIISPPNRTGKREILVGAAH